MKASLARVAARQVSAAGGGGGGGGGGGTPDAITALGAKAWVSAASLDAVADGTNIPFLEDLSGNGNHAKQFPAGGCLYKPGVTPNGGPALEMVAGGKGYSLPHVSLWGAAAEAHIFIYVVTTLGGNSIAGPWAMPGDDYYPWSSGTAYSQAFGPEVGFSPGATIVNTWSIFEARHSTTTRTFRVNGSDRWSGASTFVPPGRAFIGRTAGVDAANMRFAAFAAFDVALNDTDAAAVRTAMQAIYGNVG